MVKWVLVADWLEADEDLVGIGVGFVGLHEGGLCGEGVECFAG
jgi:hypothetical protein